MPYKYSLLCAHRSKIQTSFVSAHSLAYGSALIIRHPPISIPIFTTNSPNLNRVQKKVATLEMREAMKRDSRASSRGETKETHLVTSTKIHTYTYTRSMTCIGAFDGDH